MNTVCLKGFLVAAPRVVTKKGSSTARFRLRTEKSFLDKEGDSKIAKNEHHLSAWGYLVDSLKRQAEPGDEMAVLGELKTSYFTTKGGQKFSKTEVEIREFEITNKAKNYGNA
ncbi:MAG: single-stranded DNA-binding protein [Bacteroidetes bacterium]|nr:single-stranded DNA-binding protein [Bacteroidota bacterium]